MAHDGIVFHWKERVQACNAMEACPLGDPGKITLALSSGRSLTVDAVLVAAGRKSNVEELNLPAAGVAVGDRGLVHGQRALPHQRAARLRRR